MKTMTHFLLVLLLGSLLFAGDKDRISIPVIVYENGFTPSGTRFWASGGAGLANPNNAEVLFYNPAQQTKNENTMLIGSIQQFGKTFLQDETSEMKLGNKLLLPSYLLLAHRFDFGQLFLGYQTVYNFKKEYTAEFTTLQQPDGTGEFITNVEEQVLQNFFIGFNRRILRALNFGIKAGLLRQDISGKVFNRKIKNDADYSYALSLGLTYKINDQIQSALIYQYFNPLESKMELEAPVFVDTTGNDEYVTTKIPLPFRLPWMLDWSLYYEATPYLQFMLKIEYQEWQKISSQFENRLQLAFGAILKHENWQFRTGAFTCGQFPDKKNGMEDTPFLTAGMSYRLKSGILFSLSGISNAFFSKQVNNNLKQIERSQVLFGVEWGY